MRNTRLDWSLVGRHQFSISCDFYDVGKVKLLLQTSQGGARLSWQSTRMVCRVAASQLPLVIRWPIPTFVPVPQDNSRHDSDKTMDWIIFIVYTICCATETCGFFSRSFLQAIPGWHQLATLSHKSFSSKLISHKSLMRPNLLPWILKCLPVNAILENSIGFTEKPSFNYSAYFKRGKYEWNIRRSTTWLTTKLDM